MDDILVAMVNREDHRQMVRRVLQILKDHKLYLKPEKCEFEKNQVNYLGVIISNRQVCTNPAKVKAIWDWLTPRRLVEVQESIGFLNFYQRFIKDFSKMVQPLNDLTKKEVVFDWSNECQTAFNELKR